MTADTTAEHLIGLLEKRQDLATRAVGLDDRLEDLGVDSIDLAYVLSSFERLYDADFADTDFDLTRYRTVGDLARAIEAKLGG